MVPGRFFCNGGDPLFLVRKSGSPSHPRKWEFSGDPESPLTPPPGKRTIAAFLPGCRAGLKRDAVGFRSDYLGGAPHYSLCDYRGRIDRVALGRISVGDSAASPKASFGVGRGGLSKGL